MNDLTIGRSYEVIAVYERRDVKRVSVVCPGPFTHREACTVVSKFHPRPKGAKYVRIQLRGLES